MPFYEYECKSCGHQLEAMQKVNDTPLKKCPHCGKSQLTRLMSAPVFRLKGGGWYETDFKGDGDNKKNLADRPESDTSSSEDKKLATDAKSTETSVKETPKSTDSAEKPAAKPAPSEASKKPAARSVKSKAKAAAKKPAKQAKARR
jgi:putative FmdB family regulatory protein